MDMKIFVRWERCFQVSEVLSQDINSLYDLT